jgi:hypothetical protein
LGFVSCAQKINMRLRLHRAFGDHLGDCGSRTLVNLKSFFKYVEHCPLICGSPLNISDDHRQKGNCWREQSLQI